MASTILFSPPTSSSSSPSSCCFYLNSLNTTRISPPWAYHDFRTGKPPMAAAAVTVAAGVSVSPIPPPTSTATSRNTALSHHNLAVVIECVSYSTRKLNDVKFTVGCVSKRAADPNVQDESSPQSAGSSSAVDCVGTGIDVECLVGCDTDEISESSGGSSKVRGEELSPFSISTVLLQIWEWALVVSPFFFWGTAMVAMKEVLPKTGPFFVSAFRLIPAGLLLIAFAASRGRPLPSGFIGWFSISLFALVDATCFQGFLAEGLQRTSAGLGSVIIDSQPLTVAVLASLLFGESIGFVGVAGLVLGVIGLLLLEVPALSFDNSNFSLWGSGEWWMLLAAQSMAVGTVMVRWVSKYSDPVMATGWHMVIGGLPLVVISFVNHDPAFSGSLMELTSNDTLALLYTSIFGSAISYGVYFYNATKGSLTKLSSLTFLTPMFASIFGNSIK
ncbi:hypothetical protein U1Q18_039874 [Sarracenia purpurea var. burkii]